MRRIELFPALLCVPYLVGRLVLWYIYQPEIYMCASEYRLLLGSLMMFFMGRSTQFETLAVVGVFWVIYNLVNRHD